MFDRRHGIVELIALSPLQRLCGFRRDSKPIIDSLKKRGWTAEIIFYQDKDRGEIYRYTHEKADAYSGRVNPGNLKDETGYFQMLRELVANGIEGLPHPDAMVTN